ncbi:MAG: hypothetical protein WC812_00485 [Candidatus Pacearchaeota archaeon]|jgi:hypothetical protein
MNTQFEGLGIDYGLIFSSNAGSKLNFTKDGTSIKFLTKESGTYKRLFYDFKSKKLYYTGHHELLTPVSDCILRISYNRFFGDTIEDGKMDKQVQNPKFVPKGKRLRTGLFEFPDMQVQNFWDETIKVSTNYYKDFEGNTITDKEFLKAIERYKAIEPRGITKYKNKIVVSLPKIHEIRDIKKNLLTKTSDSADELEAINESLYYLTKWESHSEKGLRKALPVNEIIHNGWETGLCGLTSLEETLYFGGTSRQLRFCDSDKLFSLAYGSILKKIHETKDFQTFYEGLHAVKTKQGPIFYCGIYGQGILVIDLNSNKTYSILDKKEKISNAKALDDVPNSIDSIVSVPMEEMKRLESLVQKDF